MADPERKKFHLSNLLIYIAVCSFGVLIEFYPTLFSGFAHMQTAPDDPRFLNYVLEHYFQLLFNKEYIGTLWSPQFYYPFKNVLAFSENLFASAPVYIFFRIFFSPDTAFQLWMITASIFCFFSFLILLRHYNVNHLLSAFGAFLFAFGIPRIAQIGHQHLLLQFFMPLAFLFAWEFIREPDNRKLIFLVLLSYLQVLSGIYLGWFFLLSLPVLFGIAYYSESDLRSKLIPYLQHNRITVIISMLAWAGLMLTTLYPYLKMRLILKGVRLYAETDTMLPTISSYFSVLPGSIYYNLLGSEGTPAVHVLFLGFAFLLLTVISVYTIIFSKHRLTPERLSLARICSLVFFVLFILSLRLPYSDNPTGLLIWKFIFVLLIIISVCLLVFARNKLTSGKLFLTIICFFIFVAFFILSLRVPCNSSQGVSLWKIIYKLVPGGSAIAAVTRIWTVSYIYLIVGVIVCFDSLLHTISNKKLRLVVLYLILFIGISEQVMTGLKHFEKLPFLKEVDEMSELMKDGCDIAYVSISPMKPDWPDKYEYALFWTQISAMWAGLKANVPVVNGYSGNCPPTYPNCNMKQSLSIEQIIKWLGQAHRGQRLRIIFRKPLKEQDTAIAMHPHLLKTVASGNFISYTLQIP